MQAWDAHCAAEAVVFAAFQCKVFDAAQNQRWEHVFALQAQIFAMPATMPEGWRVKARIIRQTLGGAARAPVVLHGLGFSFCGAMEARPHDAKPARH